MLRDVEVEFVAAREVEFRLERMQQQVDLVEQGNAARALGLAGSPHLDHFGHLISHEIFERQVLCALNQLLSLGLQPVPWAKELRRRPFYHLQVVNVLEHERFDGLWGRTHDGLLLASAFQLHVDALHALQ